MSNTRKVQASRGAPFRRKMDKHHAFSPQKEIERRNSRGKNLNRRMANNLAIAEWEQ